MILQIIRDNWNKPGRIWNLAKSIVFSRSTRVKYYPITADIEPTLACNLNCVMCHRKELAKSRTQMTMSLADFKRVIDKLPTIMKLNLQGMGEPLATNDFFAMVSYARSKGIYVSTVSNGMLLNAARAKQLVASGLNRIYFSIDSSDNEAYRKYRSEAGDLRIVKKNISQLAELRKAEKKSALSIGIWMLLFENNVDQLVKMVELAYSIGADELIVQSNITYRGKKQWKRRIDSMQVKNFSLAEREISLALERAKELNLKMKIHSGGGAMKPEKKSLCLWPWKSLFITSQGDVSPCCIIADPNISNLGNINSDSMQDIWNNEKYQKIREQLLSGRVPDFCRGCYGK